MEKQTVENKVKEIAEAMGLTYLCESWFRANQAFDRFRRQGESREVTHPDGLTLLRPALSPLPTLCRSTTKEPMRRRSPSG